MFSIDKFFDIYLKPWQQSWSFVQWLEKVVDQGNENKLINTLLLIINFDWTFFNSIGEDQ